MLEELLRMAASAGTACSAELAQRLGVSPALLGDMLDALTRQGYLKGIPAGCSVACEACPWHSGCLCERNARVWALTQKGERLLARHNPVAR